VRIARQDPSRHVQTTTKDVVRLPGYGLKVKVKCVPSRGGGQNVFHVRSTIFFLHFAGWKGMATWAVAIPPDVIKSRWQTAAEGTYSGLGDVLRCGQHLGAQGFDVWCTLQRPADRGAPAGCVERRL